MPLHSSSPTTTQALQFRTEVETTTVEEDPRTGEEHERTVILATPRAIAAHYLQRGFWLDLLLSITWRGLGALLLLPRRKVRAGGGELACACVCNVIDKLTSSFCLTHDTTR